MFNDFLRWLANPNSAVMPAHGTIQMKFCLIRKTLRVQESLITAKFLQHFFTKSLPIIYQAKTADL
jgi:hypothetical protein